MAYYDPLTGKKMSYRTADVIRAEAPAAKKRYFYNKELGLQEQALEQSAEQFNEQIALEQEAIKQQAQQAQQAQAISALGLAATAGPRVYKAGKGLYNLAFGGESAPAVDTAAYVDPALEVAGPGSYPAPVYDSTAMIDPALEVSGPQALETAIPSAAPAAAEGMAGYTAGEQAILGAYTPVYQTSGAEALLAEGADVGGLGAGEAAASSGAGGGFSSVAGPVAAIIAGQHILSNLTDSEYEGIPSGDVFSERPRFFEDPWISYVSSKSGNRVPGGQQFEAAVQRGDYPAMARRVPAAFDQWGNPIAEAGGKSAGGFVAEKTGSETLGDVAESFINPLGPAATKIGEAKDIGDVAVTLATGGLSHFCTAIGEIIGMSKTHTAMMKIFRNWATENRRDQALHYFKFGGDVVKKIRASFKTRDEEKAFFQELKRQMVIAVLKLMTQDLMEEACDLYWGKYLELTKKYTPELMPGYARAQMPEV